MAPANLAQAAAEPGVAQRAVDGDGAVKVRDGRRDSILRGQQKSFQGERLGVARGEGQAFFQRRERFRYAAKAEFQLRDALPGEAELG